MRNYQESNGLHVDIKAMSMGGAAFEVRAQNCSLLFSLPTATAGKVTEV
jgi:hypothetical protein